MGVTVLQTFPDAFRYGYKEVEKLHTRIAHLGAQPNGVFQVDCDTYYMNQQNSQFNDIPGSGSTVNKKLHILHNTETPASTYAIIESPGKQVTLCADLMFDLLLPRLSHMYTAKKNLKVETKGTRFTVSDFIVKIGSVSMSSGQYKGILVEVEYLACSVPALCWPILREFLQSFMGFCVSSQPPPYLQARFQQVQGPQDTMQQYLEKFNEFRESSAYPVTGSLSASQPGTTSTSTPS
ncbi:mediator of RNA polymerase II transcription subunit 20 isoform X1 [Hyalella azteca]|uniref:Mediator of RNA polymerase II transcription subunit 20 n=1 Tax=Hyalella azteca TaxID=294128 RepID=A0A8B7NA84_HYAAZ|nr:mediator of RNA polymerase II transcription subunit 20 isoform X1 [Hyalella azteca]